MELGLVGVTEEQGPYMHNKENYDRNLTNLG